MMMNASDIEDQMPSHDEHSQFHQEMQRMAQEMMDEDFSEEEFEGDCLPNEDIFSKLLMSQEPHKDVRTMSLTPDERQWALDLKQVAKEHPELHPLIDFEYAQYAIISQGNQEDAIKRMTAMQLFREVYQVDNSIEQGIYMLGELMNQQPGFVLRLDVDSVTLESLHGFNDGALDPHAAAKPCSRNGVDYNWRIFICGMYYYIVACQPCFGTVRMGSYSVADCGTLGWKQADMDFHYRFSGEMFVHYPIRFTKMRCYNTNQITNMCFSMLRKVFPRSLMSVVELGCQVPLESHEHEPKTLSDIYLKPDLESACIRMLSRAKDLLTLRKRNEELFRL